MVYREGSFLLGVGVCLGDKEERHLDPTQEGAGLVLRRLVLEGKARRLLLTMGLFEIPGPGNEERQGREIAINLKSGKGSVGPR